MKDVERASNDASWCMHDLLTRLPPSKHVLRLRTPLILKIENNFRTMGEIKHKFREAFKPLKTHVSQKYFPTTFISVSPYCLPPLAESKLFPTSSWGLRFRC
jgi:hypothetical protein